MLLLTADEVKLKKQELETKPPATAMIQSALSAYELGLGVFPIAPRAKKPPLTPNGFKDASFDTDDIERWWTKTPHANIGISCGASGICVLDFDNIEDVPAWVDKLRTYKVRTSRGLHVYLYDKRATANMYNASGKHIGELKGLGGYVIGAGSEHPDGPIYTIIDSSPIITAPDDVDQLLKSTKAPVDASTTGPKIPRGQHDTELHRIAGKLRHIGMEEEAIYTTLVEVVEKRCIDYGSDYLDMCRKHAHNICKKPVGTETNLTIGGKPPAKSGPRTAPQTTATAPASKRLSVQTASTVVTKKVQWLWKHRVPLGKLTLFVGVPGSGKSLCAGDVAARLSTGANWFDADNTFKPSETLMLVGEDDVDDTTTPRLQAAGADLDKIHFVKSVITDEGKGETPEEREIQFDTDLAQIEEHLKSNPNIRLIVVDPVSNYMGSAKMNAEQEVRAVLIPLKNLAERMGVSIIAVMHLNKKSDTGAINRVGGAMAFVGVARAAYLFQASDEELEEGAVNRLQQHFMVLLKCNITKKVDGLVYEIPAKPVSVEGSDEYMPIIKFIGTTTTNAEGLLQQKSETRGRPSEGISVAKAWLREYLKDGPKPSAEVIKSAKELQNLSSRTVERAKSEIGVVSEKPGKTWLWSLPHQPDAIDLNARSRT
jgi:putative DNA primase/helicase